MSLITPEDFTREWEKLDDPKAIREVMERDQEAEDERRIRESNHGQAEA